MTRLAQLMLEFMYKHRLVFNLFTLLSTVLLIVNIIDFYKSGYTDSTSGILSATYLLVTVAMLFLIINRDSFRSYIIMKYFVNNQENEVSDEELSFFYQEAEKEGFRHELDVYLKSLNRKPLIKECMIKCLELSKNKEDLSA